jgi:Rrf2 family transcriptional regulator, cysteine metabolism repressor
MKVSVKAEYALQAIFDLATRPPNEPIRIAEIARRQKIPQKFLELILSSLKQAGFVESRRGADGGYLLARPAASIHVGEIIRHIDGPTERRACNEGFADFWNRVDGAVGAIVDQTSIQQLVEEWQARQSQYVANWEI